MASETKKATYHISPITRIEGNAEISLFMNNNGKVDDAHFHVTEFKGFETFLTGRLVEETPRITTRICGICPVSHHMAAAKATDSLFQVEIPETAKMLRELMTLGQVIHSHALHFFFLSAPDFILDKDAKPEEKHFLTVLKKEKDIVKNAIRLRSYGQDLIRTIGGKAVHPVSAIPGGISHPLSSENRTKLLTKVNEVSQFARSALDLGYKLIETIDVEDSMTQTSYMGLTKQDGTLDLYDGHLRFQNKNGSFESPITEQNFENMISERVSDYSYLKLPYYKPLGWPNGIYRVGPLARLNVSDKISTEKANEVFQDYRSKYGQPVHSTFLYHIARLVEIVYGIERSQQLLEHPEITDTNTRVKVEIQAGTGIGIVEAPRGSLIHHYKTDSSGRILKANLIVATVHNNPAMNMSIKHVASECVEKKMTEQQLLNRVEMAIRAYDPCLTCAAHTRGKLPIKINIISNNTVTRTIV